MTSDFIPCPQCGTANIPNSPSCYQCHAPLGFAMASNILGYDTPTDQPKALSQRSQGVAFVLSCFLGLLGADRLYLGKIGSGIAKGLLGGGALVAILASIATGGSLLLLSVSILFIMVNLIWSLFDTIKLGSSNVKDADGLELIQNEKTTGMPQKSRKTALVLAMLLGHFGAARFYLGYPLQGFVRLFTTLAAYVISTVLMSNWGTESLPARLPLMFISIWNLIDTVLIGLGKMKDSQGNSLILSGTPQSPTLPFHGYGYTTTPPAPAHDPVSASPGTQSL